MKYIIIAILLTASLGCKKSDSAVAMDGIQGKWELRKSQAGMSIGLEYTAGNANYLVFTGTNYQVLSNGVATSTGTFKVRTESTVIDGCPEAFPYKEMAKLLWTPAVGDREPFFYIDGNRLKLMSGCFALDGGIYSEWERVD